MAPQVKYTSSKVVNIKSCEYQSATFYELYFYDFSTL